MISIYTDEDVDVLIKPLLNAKGLTVFTTLDEGMLGRSDQEQLKHAVKLRCIFLTHNRIHFEELYNKLLKENKEHYGIIIAGHRNIYGLASRIARLFEMHTLENIKNNLWYI